jgi:hypothetical protein
MTSDDDPHQVLRAHRVTHVLNTAGVACANYHEGTTSLVYKTVHLYDSPRQVPASQSRMTSDGLG